MSIPPRSSPTLAVRILPYFNLTDVTIRIANDAIDFFHKVTHPVTKQTAKVAASHAFTTQEIATLNAGGTVVIKDQVGNSWNVKL
jgi:hypothetical protein